MTITSTVTITDGLAADGVATTFDYPFRILAATDLRVLHRPTGGTTVVVGSGYTVSGVGAASGGTVTFDAAPAAGTIWLELHPAETQATDYDDARAVLHETFERDLDRRALVDIYQGARLDRSVHFPPEERISGQTPKLSDRANRIAMYDAGGAPAVYGGGVTPTVVSGSGILFETAVAVSLASIDAAVDAIETQGYSTAGDGGGARYKRVASEPSHAAKLQSADGAWWAHCGDYLRPEQLSAVIGDGATDERAALLAAHNAQVALGVPLVYFQRHACDGDLEIVVGSYDDRINVRSANPGYAGVTFFSGGGFDFKHGDGSITLVRPQIIGLLVEDGEDTAAWIATPLLRIWRTSFAAIEDNKFDGKDRRGYGAQIGYGDTVWASRIVGNQFSYCQVGCVYGWSKDATHVTFQENTCDHNKIAGAVACNPTCGGIIDNSFEQNEGRIGLAVLSKANGGPANALNVTIRGNYIYNNAIDHPGDADSIGLLLGHDVPGTSLTSGAEVWLPSITHNYIVSSKQARAIKANIAHWGRVADNVVLNDGASAYDIELAGATQFVVVDGNKNQSLAAFDRVKVASGGWAQPVVMFNTLATIPSGSVIYWGFSSDSDASISSLGMWLGTADIDITQRRCFVGALVGFYEGGGVDRVLFDIATDIPNGTRARLRFRGTVSQTNGHNEQLLDFELTPDLKDGTGVVDTSAALTVTHTPLTPRDNRVLTYSGGQLLMRSDNNWVMNGAFEVSTLFG